MRTLGETFVDIRIFFLNRVLLRSFPNQFSTRATLVDYRLSRGPSFSQHLREKKEAVTLSLDITKCVRVWAPDNSELCRAAEQKNGNVLSVLCVDC